MQESLIVEQLFKKYLDNNLVNMTNQSIEHHYLQNPKKQNCLHNHQHEYNYLLKLLGVNTFDQACLKIGQVNQSSKFIKRVKQMSLICQPNQKDISLNRCWKLIKKAVYEMQKAKELGQNGLLNNNQNSCQIP